MHLVQRVAAIVLTLGLSASLVGCGFHLKGTNPTTAPVAYSKMRLVLPNNTEELQEKLAVYLGATGIQLSENPDAYVLRVLDYNPQRHELNGKLVETLLRLTVTFRIEDAQGQPLTEPRTITASRSYQYNVETVNTDDQEQKYLNQVIIDDLAQQIVRQIASNRLPKVVTKSSSSTTQPE
ncbi:LPS assembly lipoprotein LptE [Acinetobacter albensis]|uniref:LPS-assembly lipoprotein LptE n=1 Tax=Acinetobacter albensis TaxID=1673609 RepID=A0ABW9JSD2_9GAMM